MKPLKNFSTRSFVALATIILVVSSSLFAQSPQSSAPDKSGERQLNMLVLGDSIMWGQGLKDEHKAWYEVKTWLQRTLGRDVRARVEAHSGALIGSAEDPPTNSGTPVGGEVNRAVPTVNEQIDNARRSYADSGNVDLVLVDGCINDIDARRFLNASNTPDGIRELAQAKCGAPVEALLEKIASSFPNAHVVITGYYPIISEKTSKDLFMRALTRRLYTPVAGAPRIKDKELRERLIGISKMWHQVSDEKLADAARSVDAKMAATGSRQRVLFAGVKFLPEHSFGARDSRFWGFDASPLWKLIVILAFGKVSIRTNDEQRNQRSASCKEAHPTPAGETKDQKWARKGRLMLCGLAALGHPNRKGATMYAEAISRQLSLVIGNPGWLGDRRIATPASPTR